MGGGGGGGGLNTGDCAAARFSGHDYAICSYQRTFDAAASVCQSYGMRLIRIDSSAENSWFAPLVSDGWLGASDSASEGEWRWTDGEQFWQGDNKGTPINGLYNAWSRTDPSGQPGAADCARIDSSGRVWVDVTCDGLQPFVCEAY